VNIMRILYFFSTVACDVCRKKSYARKERYKFFRVPAVYCLATSGGNERYLL
jgi:hypothetical protein